MVEHLGRFGAGLIGLEQLQATFTPLFAADPLDVAQSDETPWRTSAHDTRLLWRIVYLFDSADAEEERDRALARRIVTCLHSTRDSALTHELLPVITDQDRLCLIVEKHCRGVISRTSFLSVLAESGYPPHVKLWLHHAGPAALSAICALLQAGDYRRAADALERPPT
jgi:hypothetical protein